MHSSKKHLPDIIFISVLLIASLALLIITNVSKADGAYVIVRVNGEDVQKLSLNENVEVSLNGGTNTLVIENGYAYMKDADCPDRICINQGKIRYTGECITCLPNKLTVTVYGNDDDIDLKS